MFCALLATTLIQTTVDLPRFPSLSPNGDRICFSWRGDLWSVSSSGGHAQRLTAHSANETRSAWSPDGAEIVFESDRDGVRNLWCMAADGTGKFVTDVLTLRNMLGMLLIGGMLARLCMPDPTPGICMPLPGMPGYEKAGSL